MNDRDVLQDAISALRTQHDGQRPGSGFTRAQVMTRLHRKRRRRLLRWLGLTPIAALVAGSAWAQASDAWPTLWQNVRDGVSVVLGLPAEQPPPLTSPSPALAPPPAALVEPAVAPTSATAPSATAPSATATTAAPSPPPDEPAPEPVIPSALPRAAPERSVPPSKPVPRLDRPLPRSEPSSVLPAAVSSSPPEAADAAEVEPRHDPELRDFRAAHDTHFGTRSPSAAIAAYRRYLKHYPKGRFVPEAQYNLALLHLKHGEQARAEKILGAFARGAYGAYRRAEARALLEALRARSGE